EGGGGAGGARQGPVVQADRRATYGAAEVVSHPRREVGGAEQGSGGAREGGAEADRDQVAHQQRRRAGGAAAHGGRRLPRADALPEARRPEPEGGRGRAGLSPGVDAQPRSGAALAGG